MLKAAILEQLDRLDEDQQRRVLEFIYVLAGVAPDKERPPQAAVSPDDVDWTCLDQGGDAESEGVEADEW
jgi:hypothetical protein